MCHKLSFLSLSLFLIFSFYLNLHKVAALVLPLNSDIRQITDLNSTRNQLCPFSSAPVVSLSGDVQGKTYKTINGFDCLDLGSPHKAECWDILELDDWLPQWFLKTPQCPQNASSEADCNIRDPPEAWTATFMRIATGSPDWNGCSEVGGSNCQYKPDSKPDFCFGGIDTRLSKARYNYVAYTISSMYLQPFFVVPNITMRKLICLKTFSNSLLGGQV